MLSSPVALEPKLRAALIAELQQRVLDGKDLAGDVHLAHVNYEGALFVSVHPFLGELYTAVIGHVDTLGERIRQLGGQMLGTSRTVAERSKLAPYPEDLADGLGHQREVYGRVVAWCQALRGSLKVMPGDTEPVTAQLVLDVLIDLEKRAWMLAAMTPTGAPAAPAAMAPGAAAP